MIRVKRLDEFHPGAKTLPESIDFFIEKGLSRGISREALIGAIQLYVDAYYGYSDREDLPKFGHTSDEFAGLRRMEIAIETMKDDGYPEEWVYRALAEYLDSAIHGRS